jgi:predicted pyridoxine 5'-phosphate oxidase superfamily flavin-nucleotide-binding protein
MGASTHEGEQAVQRRAGEGHEGWGSPMFTADIPPGFADFMYRQRLIAIAVPDDRGAVWCTVLTGDQGFVDATGDRTIVIHALPPEDDPVRQAFDSHPTSRDVGMVVMSPDTLRRVKVNGAARRDGSTLLLRTEQVLGNCPKYLQLRTVTGSAPSLDRTVRTGTELSADQYTAITRADTFFIGSYSPRHGVDANHRGGQPGFVTVIDSRTVAWPDYVGNSFYMTLGNMELNPRCGLVFLDWTTGATLQLTGTGRIDWSKDRAAAFPGALRTIEFHIERFVQIDNASPLRWTLHRYSRFNPPAPAGRPDLYSAGGNCDEDR